MLNEYKDNEIWRKNIDAVSLRSDILVSARVVEMLGDVNGKKILDDGCGNGKVSRMLSKRGAMVYGVDAVEDQIDVAKNIKSNITYLVGNMTELDALALPKDFDVVISLMTFLYLDKKQFLEALKQVKSHLCKGGRFVYANIHPSRYSSQFKMKDKLPTVDGKVFETTFYNHSMSFIKEAFDKAGLKVKEVIEPMASKEEIGKYPALFAQNTDTPQYVLIDSFF